MRDILRKTISHPALALAGTVLWGFVEFTALLQASWREKRAALKGSAAH